MLTNILNNDKLTLLFYSTQAFTFLPSIDSTLDLTIKIVALIIALLTARKYWLETKILQNEASKISSSTTINISDSSDSETIHEPVQ